MKKCPYIEKRLLNDSGWVYSDNSFDELSELLKSTIDSRKQIGIYEINCPIYKRKRHFYTINYKRITEEEGNYIISQLSKTPRSTETPLQDYIPCRWNIGEDEDYYIIESIINIHTDIPYKSNHHPLLKSSPPLTCPVQKTDAEMYMNKYLLYGLSLADEKVRNITAIESYEGSSHLDEIVFEVRLATEIEVYNYAKFQEFTSRSIYENTSPEELSISDLDFMEMIEINTK